MSKVWSAFLPIAVLTVVCLLFYLMLKPAKSKEKEFDISYKIVLLGFGNGGHIALTYASLYEKYWNILDSIIILSACSKPHPSES